MSSILLGSLHCHTTNSDGDSSPATVVDTYHRGGYGFVAITDHNRLTAPEEGRAPDGFCLLAASENTRSSGGHPVHLNGIGLKRPFDLERPDASITEVLHDGVRQCRDQGAFAQVNHPAWRWAFGAEAIAASGADAFEIHNGNLGCNSAGLGDQPSGEAMWDDLLSRGIRIWGTANDDAHHFAKPPTPWVMAPFRGFQGVRCGEKTPESILAALFAGDFYASTGVRLTDWSRDGDLSLTIHRCDGERHLTTFIGSGGRILARQEGETAHYVPKGDEGYVRASILSSDGLKAWTQPVYLA